LSKGAGFPSSVAGFVSESFPSPDVFDFLGAIPVNSLPWALSTVNKIGRLIWSLSPTSCIMTINIGHEKLVLVPGFQTLGGPKV
jgi:hypothetical protein